MSTRILRPSALLSYGLWVHSFFHHTQTIMEVEPLQYRFKAIKWSAATVQGHLSGALYLPGLRQHTVRSTVNCLMVLLLSLPIAKQIILIPAVYTL